MKNLKTKLCHSLTLLTFAAALAGAPALHAQVILGEFYNASGPQTVASASDFTSAGVAGVSNSDTVTGFDIGPTFGLNTPITSGGLTFTGSGFSYPGQQSGPNPVYQQTILDSSSSGITISGLSSILKPGERYTLSFLANSINYGFSSETNNSFTYGEQTGSADGVATVGGTDITFSFHTHATPADSLILSTVPTTPGDGNFYPGISGFAIVDAGAVPEPSTYALLLGGLAMAVVAVKARARRA